MMLSGWSACCTCVRIRFKSSKAQVKPKLAAVGHHCHPSAPLPAWEADGGESLKACGSAGLGYAVVNNKEALSPTQWKIVLNSNSQGCCLNFTHMLWHVNVPYTHTHTPYTYPYMIHTCTHIIHYPHVVHTCTRTPYTYPHMVHTHTQHKIPTHGTHMHTHQTPYAYTHTIHIPTYIEDTSTERRVLES